jgi:hypothetical protein
MRGEEGLPASREATRAVILESPATTQEFGFPMTLAEFRLVSFRSNIGEHAALAERYARQCLRRHYGGVYYGGDARGQFIGIPLTTGSPHARAQLAKRSAMGARFLRVPRVSYTAAELTAAKERIADEIRDDPDFHSISPRVSANRVIVRLHPFTETRAAELRQRYGDIVRVVS